MTPLSEATPKGPIDLLQESSEQIADLFTACIALLMAIIISCLPATEKKGSEAVVVTAPCLVIGLVVLAVVIRPSSSAAVAEVLRALAEPLSAVVLWRKH